MRSSGLGPDFWVHLGELFIPRGGMRTRVMKLWWCNRKTCVAVGWLLTIWNFSNMLFWIGDLNQCLVSLFTEFTTTLCYDKKTDTMCYHETPISKQTCSILCFSVTFPGNGASAPSLKKALIGKEIWRFIYSFLQVSKMSVFLNFSVWIVGQRSSIHLELT